jgi:hypothetical protein
LTQTFQLAREGPEDLGRIASNGGVELLTANIDGGRLGIQHEQSLHEQTYQLIVFASLQMPGRRQKDKPPQREHRSAVSPNNMRANDQNQSHPRAIHRMLQRELRPRCTCDWRA